MKYGNSSKLGSKAMKPALENSFYLKIKRESNRLIGIVGMIESLLSRWPLSCNSRKCFKKSWGHRFCDYSEIVILSVDLHWLLKNIQCTQKVKPSNAPSPSQKCTRILENDKEHVQLNSRGTFLVKKFLTRRQIKCTTLKFQKAAWILWHIPEKISSQQDFS